MLFVIGKGEVTINKFLDRYLENKNLDNFRYGWNIHSEFGNNAKIAPHR